MFFELSEHEEQPQMDKQPHGGGESFKERMKPTVLGKACPEKR